MKFVGIGVTAAFATVLAFGSHSVLLAAPSALAQSADSQSDNNIHAELQNALKNSRFSNVKVNVQNGIVDLEGSVKDFATKEEADKKAHRVKNVTAVRNNIQVSGAGEVSDQQLQDKLVKAIEYDRVGYGTTAFNSISVNVQNGVVTLGGQAYGPVDADSAVSVASHTPGVRDVIDNIQVEPPSPMDDQTRIAVYRAVYGFPSLNKYAIDPGKPIRIAVNNGHVTLAGQVDSQADKDAAGIRANSVPNVFSVTNNLQVANQGNERKK